MKKDDLAKIFGVSSKTRNRFLNDVCPGFIQIDADGNLYSPKDIFIRGNNPNIQYENHLTDKRFLAYKGILNLIFGFALRKGIIEKNPVQSIKSSISSPVTSI